MSEEDENGLEELPTRPERSRVKLMLLEQQVADLKEQLAVIHATGGQASLLGLQELRQFAQYMKEDIEDLAGALKEIQGAISARDKAASDERKGVRVALISLVGTIAAALIAAGATILVVLLS